MLSGCSLVSGPCMKQIVEKCLVALGNVPDIAIVLSQTGNYLPCEFECIQYMGKPAKCHQSLFHILGVV